MVEVCSKISRPGILYNLIDQLHVDMVDAIILGIYVCNYGEIFSKNTESTAVMANCYYY